MDTEIHPVDKYTLNQLWINTFFIPMVKGPSWVIIISPTNLVLKFNMVNK